VVPPDAALEPLGFESDGRLPDGGITIYAEQGKRPLWITLHPTVGGPGTTYNLIGAQVVGDTVK